MVILNMITQLLHSSYQFKFYCMLLYFKKMNFYCCRDTLETEVTQLMSDIEFLQVTFSI